MQPRSIARGVRNNTYFVRFNIAVDSIATTSTLTSHRITHVLCPGMTPKRRNWIDRVSHLFMRKFTLAKSHYQHEARKQFLGAYENILDRLNCLPRLSVRKLRPTDPYVNALSIQTRAGDLIIFLEIGSKHEAVCIEVPSTHRDRMRLGRQDA